MVDKFCKEHALPSLKSRWIETHIQKEYFGTLTKERKQWLFDLQKSFTKEVRCPFKDRIDIKEKNYLPHGYVIR